MKYQVKFATKWSDFDPNRHMRHTAYNEYAAEVRIRYFSEQNFSIEEFTKHHIGPILFTEETSFRKEIHLGEDITVNYDDYLSTVNVERMNDEWKKGE